MKFRSHLPTFVAWLLLLSAHFANADEPLGPPDEFSPGTSLPLLGARHCLPMPEGRSIGIADAVLHAICSTPKVRQAAAVARAQEAAVGAARSAYFPALNAKIGATQSSVVSAYDYSEMGGGEVRGNRRSRSLSGEIRLSWTLLDFGRRASTLERDQALLSEAISSRDEALQNVFFSAAQAFYLLKEKLAAADAARRYEVIAAYSEEVAAAKHRAGAGNLSDELQAKTSHRRAIVDQVNAEGEARVAAGKLAVAMGLDATHPLDVASDENLASMSELADVPVDSIIDVAMQRRPILRAAKAKLDAQRANEGIARSEFMPVVSLVGTLSDVKSRNDHAAPSESVTRSHGNVIGVQIEIPFFDGFATHYHVAQARATFDARQAELDDLELQISLEVWSSYSEVKTCEQNLANSAHLLSDAQQALSVAKGRYKAGVGGFTELLNAQVELADAQKIRVHSVARLHNARLMLAKSLGGLHL